MKIALTFTLLLSLLSLKAEQINYFDLLTHHPLTQENSAFKDSAMCFCFGGKNEHVAVTFAYHNGRTGVIVDCTNTTQYFAPDTFALYKQQPSSNSETEVRYIYPPDFDIPQTEENQKMSDIIPDPSRQRKINQTEQFYSIITVDECASLLQNKKVVFYTGAGISAGVVPTMNGLLEQLDLNSYNLSFIDKIIGYFYPRWIYKKLEPLLQNPEKYKKVMDQFYCCCIDGEPTKAHQALASLVQKKNCAIVTENIDALHQKTGIFCLARTDDDMLKHIDPEQLKDIEVIFCIGMSEDQSGLLSWYKELNPAGIIVALDKNVPCYLGDKDKLLQGDIQTVLPEMAVMK